MQVTGVKATAGKAFSNASIGEAGEKAFPAGADDEMNENVYSVPEPVAHSGAGRVSWPFEHGTLCATGPRVTPKGKDV